MKAGSTSPKNSVDRRPRRSMVGVVLFFTFVLASSSVLFGCGEDLAAKPLGGNVRTPTPLVGDLSVPNTASGSDFTLRAEPNQVLLVYFGYTSCPDVCPTTLADLSAALDKLGNGADQIDVAMITIDPDRDTDEILGGYVNGFIEGSIGVRTTDAVALRDMADRLGANYSVETTAEGVIEVAHTAFLYAINEEGELMVSWAFGTPPDEIEQDLEILLARIQA